MRTNLPVSDVEYPITDETLIVSKTDTKGRLTYFNDQFVHASGFTDAELMGQPHNIIRLLRANRAQAYRRAYVHRLRHHVAIGDQATTLDRGGIRLRCPFTA